MRHCSKRPEPRCIAQIHSDAAVRAGAQKPILADTQTRLRGEAIYAQIAVDDSDCQPRRNADPRVRREAQWTSKPTRSEAGFGDDSNRDLVGCKHERRGIRACIRERNTLQHDWPAHVRTLALVAVSACQYDVGQADRAFYNWDDRKVHCAVNIDSYAHISAASIETGLDRAQHSGEVLELYTHNPGVTVTWEAIETVLEGANARGLAFVTYADIVEGKRPNGGGLALSFDDSAVSSWTAGRELFQRYGARLTFFVSNWNPSMRDGLRTLAADGHDIEAHSVHHLRGPVVVEERGLDAYISEEIVPSINVLRSDGFPTTTFAYPYGARTSETDRAILNHVSLLRSVTFTWDSPAVDPCP